MEMCDMKKTVLFIGFLLLVASTFAKASWFDNMDANKDGKVTQQEWVAQNKKTKAKQGKKFDEAQAVKTFLSKDANKDGVLSRNEVGS
jgi:Ca2+-binding EF-hand superfamily protein